MKNKPTLKSLIQKLIFILLCLFLSSTQLMAESAWKPDYELAKKLLALTESEIESSFNSMVLKQDRANYAVMVSWRLVYKLRELGKARVFLKIAESELQNNLSDNRNWATYHMLKMSIAESSYDRNNVIKHGVESLAFVKKAGDWDVKWHSYLLRSISDAFYTLGDYTNSASYAKEMAELARQAKYDGIEADALFYIAESKYKLSELESAKIYANKSFKLYEKLGNTTGLGHSSKVLGSIYAANGEREKSKESFLAAIHQYKKVKNHHGVANCNFNLGIMHRRSKDYGEALMYLEDAAYHFMQSGSASGAGMAKMEQGKVHDDMGELDRAIILYEEAKILLNKTHSLDRVAQLDTYYGGYYLKVGQKEASRKSYINALKIYRNSNNKKMIRKLETYLNKLDAK